jgi:uncharacterized ParB-like nuclease family protein
MRGVKCFNDEIRRYGPYATIEAGLRVIEVKRITGSVNKCHELDRLFRTRRRGDRKERWRRSRLKGHSLQFYSIPPIDVYLLSGEYYVIDGNRRVAAAKQFGLEFMDAHVTECVPHSNREAQRGAVSRRLFEQQTGLKNIRLDYTSGYADLLEEVREYAGQDDLAESARQWYSRVYLPRIGAIAESELKRRYEHTREGDLYLMVSRFFKELMGGIPQDVGFGSVLSSFMFARRLRSKRFFRRFPMRQLYRFLRGGVPPYLHQPRNG